VTTVGHRPVGRLGCRWCSVATSLRSVALARRLPQVRCGRRAAVATSLRSVALPTAKACSRHGCAGPRSGLLGLLV